ncbi:hypothetical protein FBY58_1387 [Zymomonas mobilis]|uniref:Uncharacterized protein n=1 Tax=Zymomonas mobilis TaxID=542 RepID=A0A542W2I7_ZYMMB|nr:hypothetical protein FBY58_1387 [Zymomonas mobilis]
MISRRNFFIRISVITVFAVIPFFGHGNMKATLPKPTNKYIQDLQKQANLGDIKARKIISAISEGRQDGLDGE